MDIISFIQIMKDKASKSQGLDSLVKSSSETGISNLILGVGNKLVKFEIAKQETDNSFSQFIII